MGEVQFDPTKRPEEPGKYSRDEEPLSDLPDHPDKWKIGDSHNVNDINERPMNDVGQLPED